MPATRKAALNQEIILNTYPNPTSNFLNIEMNNQEILVDGISITNIQGKTFRQIDYGSSILYWPHIINVSDLAVGSYFLHIHTNSGEFKQYFQKF